MPRKRIIEDQTTEELAFQMAVNAVGGSVTSQQARFYFQIIHLVQEDADFKVSEVIKIYKETYKTN